MWYHVFGEILIIFVIVVCFLVSIDVSFFQANYGDRLAFLKCSFHQAGEIVQTDAKDCCGSHCFYHASVRDADLAQFWEKTVTVSLSYLFYPIGSLFVK